MLARFGQFLVDEAMPAGGLGPREAHRLEERHLHDSLGFAAAWHGETAPASLIDVGSGVGLPGIPLAILWPACDVILIERSGRRARLLRRSVRMLGLDQVRVHEGDVFSLDRSAWSGVGVVMRAVFPPHAALARLTDLSWERLVVASGDDDRADWGERIPYQVFARHGWVRTMRRA